MNTPVSTGSLWHMRFWMLTQGFLLVLFVGGVILGIQLFLNPLIFPISDVRVIGDLRYLDKIKLQEVILPEVTAGFFGLNMQDFQQKIQAEPWLEQVKAKREWPGRLRIEITEHKPRALWGERGVISTHGDLFYPISKKGMPELPILVGPEIKLSLVWQNFLAMEKVLAPLELYPKSITLASRGAWEIVLNNDIRIVLGTQDVLARLRRFTRAYHKLWNQQENNQNNMAHVAYVDLRYTSGMAVGWRS